MKLVEHSYAHHIRSNFWILDETSSFCEGRLLARVKNDMMGVHTGKYNSPRFLVRLVVRFTGKIFPVVKRMIYMSCRGCSVAKLAIGVR